MLDFCRNELTCTRVLTEVNVKKFSVDKMNGFDHAVLQPRGKEHIEPRETPTGEDIAEIKDALAYRGGTKDESQTPQTPQEAEMLVTKIFKQGDQ